MKKDSFIAVGILIVAALVGCTNDGPDAGAQEAATPAAQVEQQTQPADPLTALKQQALPEEDIPARVAGRIAIVADEIYRDAANGSPLWKNPQVTVEDCVLTITNEAEGQPSRIVVPLAKLNVRDGFRLIPDREDNPYPGIAIQTVGEEPVVEVTWGGKVQKNNEFSFKLQTREQFERLVPALVHAVHLCNGTIK